MQLFKPTQAEQLAEQLLHAFEVLLRYYAPVQVTVGVTHDLVLLSHLYVPSHLMHDKLAA